MKQFFDREVHLGIIKGGQLGRMLLPPCMKLGIIPHIMDNNPNAPARAYCNNFTTGDATDFDDVYNFGTDLDAVTIEIENVNKDALNRLKEDGVTVYPSPDLIELVQDKGLQKQFYRKYDLPTSDFILLENRQQLCERQDLLPCVQKSRLAGYDGKGVTVINSADDLDQAFDVPSVIETKVDIKAEISVLVARNQSGEVKAYPPVEMVVDPDLNLLDYLCCPAQIAMAEQTRATAVALSLAEKLDLVGLLAVEMFVTADGDVLINEVAPRPHNSGHHTIETSNTSQYEQHLRAIFDFSLGSTEMILPAVMVNIIGEKGHSGPVIFEGIEPFLEIAGVHLHLYGKKMVQPFRKMGHVTIVRPDITELLEIAKRIKQEVKAVSCRN